MTGVINTGSNPKALWEGVNDWWGIFYNQWEDQYTQLFDTEKSDKSYEEDVQITGMGLAPKKPEGDGVFYDSMRQGFVNRSTNVSFGLGYIVTREEIDDNLYPKITKQRTQELAFSMKTTKETVGANVYNRAFDPTVTYADGESLISTTHPTLSGVQQNRLTVAADLSEASLEDLAILISRARNDRDLQIKIKPRCLIVSPENQFEANRILKSYLQNDTGNNAINALNHMGIFPEGIKVNQYLTDPDAFFIRTDCPVGLVHYERQSIEFTNDNDFDTENFKAKAYERYSFTARDFRSIFASPGV